MSVEALPMQLAQVETNPFKLGGDVVNVLLQRVAENADPNGQYGGVSSTQLLTMIQEMLAIEAAKPRLLHSPATAIACTTCGRLNAPAYYLKHSHGRYAVLCYDNGQGCWEQSANVMCTYSSQHVPQCTEPSGYNLVKSGQLLGSRSHMYVREQDGHVASRQTSIRQLASSIRICRPGDLQGPLAKAHPKRSRARAHSLHLLQCS
jgi:hypothetical protein